MDRVLLAWMSQDAAAVIRLGSEAVDRSLEKRGVPQ
jgi:hypothetical protein